MSKTSSSKLGDDGGPKQHPEVGCRENMYVYIYIYIYMYTYIFIYIHIYIYI